VPFALVSYYGIEAFKPPASYKYKICNVRLDPERSEEIELARRSIGRSCGQ
jgi:hypothetical protein